MATNIEHLETKIEMTEDALLRTRDPHEEEELSSKLRTMRKTLQRMKWEEASPRLF